MKNYRTIHVLLSFGLAALLLSGCGSVKQLPNLQRLFSHARARTGKRPIVFVPGFTGTALVNAKTGDTVWPGLFRSSRDEIDLPIRPDFRNAKDDLVTGKVLANAKVFSLLPEIQVFEDLFDGLEFAGYQKGDIDNPAPGGDRDTYYMLPYDWRRDQVESAGVLMQKLDQLKQKLNRPDLRFNLITVSGGGTISRYAAMYGEADLPADGSIPQPTWAGARHINKIFMVGSPNEGTAEMLAILNKGYSITQGLNKRVKILRKMSRADAFSSPAVFETLPFGDKFTLLDENLQPFEVDLYDPRIWRQYGWSVAFDDDYRRDFEHKQGRPLADLDAYLAAVLKRAKHYQQALAVKPTAPPPVSYFAFGADCEETFAAPVILYDKKYERYETLVTPRELKGKDGRKIKREEVIAKMFDWGDGRVTRRSMLAYTEDPVQRSSAHYSSKLPFDYAIFVCGAHGMLHANKFVLDNALTLLLDEAMN